MTGIKDKSFFEKYVKKGLVYTNSQIDEIILLNSQGKTNPEIEKITNNFTTRICAYIIMEIIAKILPKNKVEPNIFLAVSNALDNMETNNPYTTTIYFILQFFDLLGETLSIDMADNHVFLDLDLGNFCNYKTPNSIEIDKKCYSVLSAVFNKSQQEFPDALCKMTLKMLNNVFRTKYDIEINSFNFL